MKASTKVMVFVWPTTIAALTVLAAIRLSSKVNAQWIDPAIRPTVMFLLPLSVIAYLLWSTPTGHRTVWAVVLALTLGGFTYPVTTFSAFILSTLMFGE